MPTTAAPVHRTKVELAYDFLRERILNGELAPGQKLTLASLAEMMGTSHMPVREAVLRLQQENLVELTPHTGMRVTPLRASDVRELFQVRAALEGLAARLACLQMNAADLADLRTCHKLFQSCQKADDFAGMAEANWRFHKVILTAAGNSHLTREMNDIWVKCFRFRAGYRLIPGRSNSTIKEHAAMLKAFENKDAAAAAQAAFDHSENAGTDMYRVILADEERAVAAS